MASLNKVMLMGNLTRDPELRYTPGGSAVATLGLAVNNRYKQGDEWKDDVCFVDITVWGKTAENCSQYLSKGSPVFVEGRLKYRTWESNEGQKRNKLDVTAVNVQFLSRGGGDAKDSGDTMQEEEGFSKSEPGPADDEVPF